MRNKFLTKILGATLGLAMAIGVGVGVAANNRAATGLDAANGTHSIGWGDSGTDETFSATSGTVTFATGHTATFSSAKNNAGSNPAYNSSNHQLRLYYSSDGNGGSITFTCSYVTITGFTLVSNTEPVVKYSVNGGALATAAKDTKTYTATGLTASTSLMIQNANTAANVQLQIKTISFTYTYEDVDITYTVTYDSNGGQGEMEDENSPYDAGDSVTVLNNTFTRSGYNFVCFNTQANGFGTDYNPGATFTINGDTTLYAKWKYPHTDLNNQVTWDLTKTSYSAMGENSASWVSDHVTISAAKASSSNTVNNWCPPEKEQTRFYKNSTMTISPSSGYKINSIVFDTSSNNDHATNLMNSTMTNATAARSSYTITVTPTLKTSNVVITFAGAVGVNEIVVNYATYSALSSIALSGTYPTAFMQGDAFSHEGMVVTATYANASTADVTSSAVWSGYNMSATGNQNVTVSYTEEAVEKTATYTITVSAAPCITPEKASTTAQIGDDPELISFTYENLNNDPSVVSNATSIVTVSDLYFDAGEGLVQLNFVGSGTTTVSFKDGETQLASVSVTVTRAVSNTTTKILSADLTKAISASSVTTGFTLVADSASSKTGYYQDGGTAGTSINSFTATSSSPLFANEPAAIKFTARICGGTAKDPLDHNVEACLVDSEGEEISATKQTVTTKVTGTAKDYTINLPYSSSAYGVKLMHVKETSWNVRYYSFELSSDCGTTVRTINGTEVKTDGVVTSVNSVVLRFGAKLSAENWAAFNSQHTISDYGVMFATASALSTNSLSSVQEAFSKKQSLVRFVSKGSATTPTLNNGNYVFTAKINILASSDYATVYCAVPFFVSGSQYYFLEETRCSVNSLASECLTNHSGSSLSEAALTILAGE